MQGRRVLALSQSADVSVGCGRVSLHWHAPFGGGRPRTLDPLGVWSDDLPRRDAAAAVFVARDDVRGSLARLRLLIGACAVIVVVADEPLSADDVDALFESGADDVAASLQPDDLALALRRAVRLALERTTRPADGADLAAQRGFVQASIDNLPSPIFFTGSDGRYVGCNKAFERLIGRPSAQIVGATVYDIQPMNLARIYEQADQILLRTGGTQVYETRVRFADGSLRDVCIHKSAVAGPDGAPSGIAGALLDVTEYKRLEFRLKDAADRDPLTQAFNRRKFMELAAALERSVQETRQPLSVLVMDLDHFKSINDAYGHAAGDIVLCGFVDVLRSEIGKDNMFARAGGEEFYALCPGSTVEAAAAIAERLRAKFEALGFAWEGTTIKATASFGAAELRVGNETILQAVSRADRALYQSKRAGRNKVHVASAASAGDGPHLSTHGASTDTL